jgi:hypothetical protein
VLDKQSLSPIGDKDSNTVSNNTNWISISARAQHIILKTGILLDLQTKFPKYCIVLLYPGTVLRKSVLFVIDLQINILRTVRQKVEKLSES